MYRYKKTEKKENTALGRRGEELAAQYLEQNGFRILARNYYAAHCEIDIIATDAQTLIFVEVKTRTVDPAALEASPFTNRPSRAVTAAKQRNILSAARAYLREQSPQGLRMRFDVIELYLRQGVDPDAMDIVKIHHIRNAFTVTSRY